MAIAQPSAWLKLQQQAAQFKNFLNPDTQLAGQDTPMSQQPSPAGPTDASSGPASAEDAQRGLASAPPESQLPPSATGIPAGANAQGLDPYLSQNPEISAYMPPNIPFQKTPEMIARENDLQKATDEQLANQKAGVGNLEEMLAKRQHPWSGINWSPLASYIDSNVKGSNLNTAAQSLNSENEKTVGLAEKIQDAKNNMSKDYIANLGAQYKSAQMGAQMQHQATIANAQQQKVINAQIFNAQHTFDRDPTIRLLTTRMSGAKNVLNLIHDFEESANKYSKLPQNQRIALTSQALSLMYQEITKLETGGQTVAQQLVHEGAQPIADLDWNKIKTFFTGKVDHPEQLPETLNQARLLISKMTANYQDSVNRQTRFLSSIGGMSPLQQKVFDAKKEALMQNYNDLTEPGSKSVAPRRGELSVDPTRDRNADPDKMSPEQRGQWIKNFGG